MQGKREKIKEIVQHCGVESDKEITLDFSDGILKEHNKEIYAKIIQGFAENDIILIEQTTGTGKSYLAMKLIKDTILSEPCNKVLFVSPSNVIDNDFGDNVKDILGVDVDSSSQNHYQ